MTETTQPDPRVVAWMRDRMSENPNGMTAQDVRAYREANGLSARDMNAAYREATRKPQTRADIPAGQGPASLFIAPNAEGELTAWYRTGRTHDHVFMTEGPDDPSEARRAMWDHLAATLPTITQDQP